MESIVQLNNILQSFKINAFCVNVQQVDNYIYYDLKLHTSCKVKEIIKYSDEISLALKKPNKPSIKILHGQGLVRLEFATTRTEPLRLFNLFTNDEVPKGNLITLLGQTVDGKKVWMDLSQNPHMIIAGTTGSGKSTLLHNIIANMINYNHCLLYLVDPKNIEFHHYANLRDIDVSYSYNEAMFVLDSIINTMEERYAQMRSGTTANSFPYLLLIIDEIADLLAQDYDGSLYSKLCRLSQKSRAARISIILATQRPSVNIINGDIKANFPARIACRVASHVDSKVILDSTGAENLLGQGDALLKDNFRHLERFQVAYTDPEEICKFFGNNK